MIPCDLLAVCWVDCMITVEGLPQPSAGTIPNFAPFLGIPGRISFQTGMGHFAEALAPLMERLGPKNRNGLVRFGVQRSG